MSTARDFFWKDASRTIICVPTHFFNTSMLKLMTRAFRNTPAFRSDPFNSRRNMQLKFENAISLHEILAENEPFSKLFWRLNTYLIIFDHKCYAWFESPWTVEKLGTFGFEFTPDKIGKIILSGFRFSTVSHSWHLLLGKNVIRVWWSDS